ncbi:MAG: HlyD family type I secretion periplasmic adaptor subunit [Colwellia sp.]|nr:HlyD family type I secretion periplasmic adaptor subunit [Colwellia sp.]
MTSSSQDTSSLESNGAHDTNSAKAHRKLAPEKLAFLPAALEIQAAPPPKWSRSLLWAISLLIVLLIVWASWAEIDIIATAQGKIVPSGRVKVIQPLETGVVKTIFVKEGQHVKAGDKLIALDNTASQADADRLNNEWQGQMADLSRLRHFIRRVEKKKSRIGNNSIDPLNHLTQPAVLKSLTLNQRLLLESSLQEYQSKIDSFLSEIAKLMAEKKAIKINVLRLTKTLPLITERVSSIESLLTESHASRNQYLELEQERINQEEMLNLEHAKAEQISASILSAKQNLTAYRAEIRRNTLQEINQLTRQSESTKQELTKAKRLTALRVLTTPVDGVVEELAIATIGGIVTPAQELLKIVPFSKDGGQMLEIDAGLLNKDIGFVHTGQIAEIKIDSFPFTKYGVIDGEVTDISADAIEHEQMGLLFPLKASMATDEINVDGKLVKLKPGMSVTVEIKTGTRRLMEFLLAPLMRGVSEGARER